MGGRGSSSGKGAFTVKSETIGGSTFYYVRDPKTGKPYRWGGDANQDEVAFEDKQGAQYFASQLNGSGRVTELDWALTMNEMYGYEKPEDIRKRYDRRGRPKKQQRTPKRTARNDDLPF